MTRLLAAAALAVGLLATTTPAANACDWEHCPGTSIICSTFGCPLYCTPDLPVVNRHLCLGN
jgi:hypothetical protein